MREFVTGNEAVVRGAIRAGCNFFAGYPITPASSILTGFIHAFRDGTGVAIQTEDEIAAIGQCIGASMAGARTLTATSGPGLSLYSENIGLAQMGEVPLVIVDCQRMGPATGGATATGEGDVLFARHVTAGGYPLPVLAACDVESAYWLCYEAFNISERLRTPVILLLSKDLSVTRQTAELDAIKLPPLVERLAAPAQGSYRPYAVVSSAAIPAFAPIGGDMRVRFTGSIHGEDGLLTGESCVIQAKLAHLRDKVEAAGPELEYVREDLDPEASCLIISYGLADGSAREAVAELRPRGIRVSHLSVYSLWPIPQDALHRAVTPKVLRIVIPELNIGLYCHELHRVAQHVRVESITRFDGGLIHPSEIVHQVGSKRAYAEPHLSCHGYWLYWYGRSIL
ncbi:MAG: transketolase C-terminal domain-containing protein [Planctomycetota bacterium]|jgi:2-oxoglutarate ferredoxin oxidoreductase subunit alpha